MKRISSALMALALFTIFGCQEKPQESIVKGATEEAFDIVAARTAIDANNRAFMDNYSKGDTAAMALNYSDDATLYPPEMARQRKSDVPATFGMFKRWGVSEITLSTTNLEGDGEMLIEQGNWEILAADKSKMDNGKYLVIWKNVNGSWKMYHDMWNTDNPIKRAQ